MRVKYQVSLSPPPWGERTPSVSRNHSNLRILRAGTITEEEEKEEEDIFRRLENETV